MEIELIQNKKNIYEIWCDRNCVHEILRHQGESASAYQYRAEREFETYCESMRRLKSGDTSKTIRKVSI